MKDMKFISFFGVTIILALSCHHSILGLPIEETTPSASCSDGFTMIDNECKPIAIETLTSSTETSTNPSTSETTQTQQCADGMKHDDKGICQLIIDNKIENGKTEENLESNASHPSQTCSEGEELNVNGQCESKPSINVNTNEPSITTETKSSTDHDTLHELCPIGKQRNDQGICEDVKEKEIEGTTEENSLHNNAQIIPENHVENCPEGEYKNKEGKCQQLTLNLSDQKATEKTETTSGISTIEPCPEGTQRTDDGLCQPQTNIDVEHTTAVTTNQVRNTNLIETNMPRSSDSDVTSNTEKSEPCPEGLHRDENGVCEEKPTIQNDQVLPEVTTNEMRETNTGSVESCPEGSKLNAQGVCERQERKPVERKNIGKPSGDQFEPCPEGLHRAENGICEETERTENNNKNVPVVSGTKKTCPHGTKLNEHGSCERKQGNKNRVGLNNDEDEPKLAMNQQKIVECPEGSKMNEEGSCEYRKSSSPNEIYGDPKTLLNDDGSCPDNYKLILGRCLYIKGRSTAASHLSNGKEGNSKDELVGTLEDNSCPPGTEYVDNGLCRKLSGTSSSPVVLEKQRCPIDAEWLNGECVSRTLKPTNLRQSDKSKSVANTPESRTVDTAEADIEE